MKKAYARRLAITQTFSVRTLIQRLQKLNKSLPVVIVDIDNVTEYLNVYNVSQRASRSFVSAPKRIKANRKDFVNFVELTCKTRD